MTTLQKKAVIEQLDPTNSKVEKVGHLSVKLTYPCGCQFVEHYNETNPHSSLTGQRYTEEQFAERRYWIELCGDHRKK